MPSRSPLDYLLAFVGWVLVVGGPAFPLAAVALPPDPYSQLPAFGAVAVAAAPLAWWYLRAGHSLGDLGAFYFAVVAVEVAAGIALYALVSVTSSGNETAPLWSGALLVVGAYAVAYLLVYRGGWARLRGRTA